MKRLASLAAALACLLAGRAATAAQVTEVHYLMGTYFAITVEHPAENEARRVMRHCFAETRRLEAVFSRFDPHSELSQLNQHNAVRPALSPTMVDLLEHATRLAAATQGTFDVRIGRLSQLWRSAGEWPRADQIRAALPSPAQAETAANTGAEILDFDGIAKGYAIDRCVALLRQQNISAALLSLGESSLYALGAPSGQRFWAVDLRHLETGRRHGVLRLRDEAISVSSVFGHERTVGGQRVGHIIDPRDGMPLRAAALVAVSAQNATDAEAYSKALLIAESRGAGALSRQSWSSFRGAVVVTPQHWHRLGNIAFDVDEQRQALPEAPL